MKRAAVPLAVLAVLLLGGGARADTCDVTLKDGSVAVWKGPCREGTPYGKGEVTHNGKTSKAVVEDVGGDQLRFVLDEDGRGTDARLSGQRRNRAEPPGPAKGRNSQDGFRSFEDSASASGRNRGESAGAAEGGAPAASGDTAKKGAGGKDARGKYRFRNYTPTGGGADGPDRGKPSGDGDAGDWDAKAPPASTAPRAPAAPAPDSTAPDSAVSDGAVPDDAVKGAPAHAGPAAVACKLEVARELYDWSGSCDGDGRAYGAGKGTAHDGTTYEGPAANGKAHGFGTVNAPGGGFLQGRFRNGLPHGAMVIRAADGKTYNTWYDNGVEVGERTPTEYAAPGDSEPGRADGGASGAPEAESDPWSDTSGKTQDDPWAPDPEAADSGAEGTGADRSDGDVPSYVAVLGKLAGMLVPGAAAEDEYVAAIGTLEQREAARREAERREAAEREAAAAGGRNADERPQRRAAPRDTPERRRAAAPNRSMESDRARQALRDRQRRSAERRRKSQALLQRNLKIARLQRQLNRDLSSCNSHAAELLRIGLDSCTNDTCVANCRRQVSNQRAQCRNRARRGTAIHLSRCKARARSAYRRQVGQLMTQRY